MTPCPCDQWALIHGPAPREQSPLLFLRASLFFPPAVVFPAYPVPPRHRINGSQSFQLLHSFGEGASFAEGMQRFSSALGRFASSTVPCLPPPRRGLHAAAWRSGGDAVTQGTRPAFAEKDNAARSGMERAVQPRRLPFSCQGTRLLLAALPCIARLFLSRRRKLCL